MLVVSGLVSSGLELDHLAEQEFVIIATLEYGPTHNFKLAAQPGCLVAEFRETLRRGETVKWLVGVRAIHFLELLLARLGPTQRLAWDAGDCPFNNFADLPVLRALLDQAF